MHWNTMWMVNDLVLLKLNPIWAETLAHRDAEAADDSHVSIKFVVWGNGGGKQTQLPVLYLYLHITFTRELTFWLVY